MALTLLLYWFPIFAGVAFGARLASRRHGAALGVTCAMLWVAVVQANSPGSIWHDIGLVASALCGAAAIVLIGCYGPAGEESRPEPKDHSARSRRSTQAPQPSGGASFASGPGFGLQPMVSILEEFDAWLEVHRYNDDPWADFDEFLRSMLFQWVGGTHVRTYRVLSEGDQLIPLREMDPNDVSAVLSARRGVEGYVATTGRSFVVGDPTHGDLVDRLIGRNREGRTGEGVETGPSAVDGDDGAGVGPAWCFAIVRGAHKIGIVTVERFDTSELQGRTSSVGQASQPADRLSLVRAPGGPGRASQGRCHACPWSPAQLRLLEVLIGQFWNCLTDVFRGRAAVTTDPGSGGLTRKAFFEVGREMLVEAYRCGEPVVVAVIGMEGIRALDDIGQWETADDIRATVSSVLKKRLRADDRLGRFDDSRFVLLLRRVDSELAVLIVRELMDRLTGVLAARDPSSGHTQLRCGLAGSGVTGDVPDCKQPSLERLVAKAIETCAQARRASTLIACDLQPAKPSMTFRAPRDVENKGAVT